MFCNAEHTDTGLGISDIAHYFQVLAKLCTLLCSQSSTSCNQECIDNRKIAQNTVKLSTGTIAAVFKQHIMLHAGAC